MPPITLRADRAEFEPIPETRDAAHDQCVGPPVQPPDRPRRGDPDRAGAVSALRYAEGVIRIPLNAIGPAWFAAIYPALVRASLVKGSSSFGQAAAGALRYLTVIFVPITIATAALAPVIVEVAYVRGAFDERAAILTSAALAGFAPLLFLTLANAV